MILADAGFVALLVLVDTFIMSVVYHRYLTHRSIELNRWLARGLTLFFQGMAFAPPLTWVSSHLYHHARTDSTADPYSPAVQGFWRVLLFTPILVTRWRRRQEPGTVALLCRGVPDPGFYSFCDRRWFALAMAVGFAAGFYGLFGPRGVALYALQFSGIYLVGGWINAVAHTAGERPHENSAVNRRGALPFLLNLYMAGEWLHNHHHHRPGSANFGLHGELDSGYLLCRTLAAVRLASIRAAPRAFGR